MNMRGLTDYQGVIYIGSECSLEDLARESQGTPGNQRDLMMMMMMTV